ncbi:hypothetical protein CONLIGDRAFT_634916 [Coniochaeta ligniaria NRRL 30616]|uniref:N-acetylgalactosaminide beta-1,3-galactosyltransferase n=1 Tax=Coniochaeta ligniaria NRRL 30616 TaxID=1408157 RepID=A0A1J7JGE8_9PEZI|nr:hypothetical protein CONLIGDRAFT_634916 [Coniochaeta ligniaria NRRL 30616]
MALHIIPMQVLLNKRFSRTFLFAALIVVSLSLTLYWSGASPRLRDNARGHSLTLPSWLSGPADSPSAAAPEIYPYETTSQFFPVSIPDATKAKTSDLCASFPSHLTQRIQPVLKMGHGESRSKIEAQLDTVSACFSQDELLIFSDLDETIRGRSVIDILADLPESYRHDNPDFDNYLLMQEMRRNGTLDTDVEAAKKIDGWRLDKYKFLPGLERAWAMRPGRDWYVFYETDTYIVWDNLFRFLSTLDPSKPHYMGSPSPGRVDEASKDKTKTWFANGGPGYVLSRAAVEALLVRKVDGATGRYVDPPLTLRWLDLLRRDCCGDSVMGWTLWNVSIPVEGYWPLFNPHPMHGVPYSDLYWCQPVITLHKTTPGDMAELWRWEHGRRRRDKPLLYQDLWSFRHPGDAETALLKDWDNGRWADYKPPPEAKIDSAATCRSACEASDRCLQFLWRGLDAGECVLMFQIRYGQARKPDVVTDYGEEKQPDGSVKKVVTKETRVDYTSGWMVERIQRWREERTCEAVQWVGPSITRIF